MITYKAIAPNGLAITGTLETLPGEALISHFESNNGQFCWHHSGETVIDWDSQKTVRHGGNAVFLDEAGNQWHQYHLRFTENKEGWDPEGQPGPTYSVWISEPEDLPHSGETIWRWRHEQDFTCSDDPEGRGARASAHGYARYLRKTYPASLVAVRPAGMAPKDAFL